ncbi:hypothetical protein Hanom_Chr12g01171341 [Helianthus anomalus]
MLTFSLKCYIFVKVFLYIINEFLHSIFFIYISAFRFYDNNNNNNNNNNNSKLPFWSLRFGYFCHFSPKLKPFASGSLWFQFYCHFDPKVKSVIFIL